MTDEPCGCWHQSVYLHAGHCCFRDRDVCHPIPLGVEHDHERAQCTAATCDTKALERLHDVR